MSIILLNGPTHADPLGNMPGEIAGIRCDLLCYTLVMLHRRKILIYSLALEYVSRDERGWYVNVITVCCYFNITIILRFCYIIKVFCGSYYETIDS